MIIGIGIGVVLTIAAYYFGKSSKGIQLRNEIEAELIKVEKAGSVEVKQLVASVRSKL